MSKESENTRGKARAKSAVSGKARGIRKTKEVKVKKDDFDKLLSQMIKNHYCPIKIWECSLKLLKPS